MQQEFQGSIPRSARLATIAGATAIGAASGALPGLGIGAILGATKKTKKRGNNFYKQS